MTFALAATLVATLTALAGLQSPVNAARQERQPTQSDPRLGSAEQVGKAGKVKVALRAPEGVAVQATLRSKSGKSTKARTAVVVKPADGRSRTSTLRLPAGVYSVIALTAVRDGLAYRAKAPKKISVRAGRKVKVVLRWKNERPVARLQVTTSTADAVTLAWKAPAKRKVLVRRSAGEQAPRSPKAGTEVTSGNVARVTDRGLNAGTRYSYSVFVRSGRTWVGPTSVTAGTVGVDPVTGGATPSYALAPGAIVVDAQDKDAVVVRDRAVWVQLTASRPTPALGAGVVLPISTLAPGGFLGRIVEVAPDGNSVRLVAGAMTDAFSFYDISTAPAPGGRWTRTDTATGPVPGAPQDLTSTQGRRSDDPPATACLGDGVVKTGAGVAVTFNKAPEVFDAGTSFDYEVHTSWGMPKAVSFDMYSTPGLNLDLTVTAKGSASCVASPGKFTLPLTTTPVPIALQWEVYEKFTASGAAAMTVQAAPTVKLGAKMRIGSDEDFDPVFEPALNTKAFSGSIGGDLGFVSGGQFTFGPGTEVGSVGWIAGLSGELEVLKYGLAGIYDTAANPQGCLTSTLDGSAALKFKAEAWAGPFSVDGEKVVKEGTWQYAEPAAIPEGCLLPPPSPYSWEDPAGDPAGHPDAFVDLRRVTATPAGGSANNPWPSVSLEYVRPQVGSTTYRVLVNLDSDPEPDGVYDAGSGTTSTGGWYGYETRLWPMRYEPWMVRELPASCSTWSVDQSAGQATLSFDPGCLPVTTSTFSVSVETRNSFAENAKGRGDLFPNAEFTWSAAVPLKS